MPMIWNAEAHAKLLAALMQECDVKPNQENYAALAKLMGTLSIPRKASPALTPIPGPDCTPKAIRHQVSKFRNTALAKDDSADSSDGKAKPAKTATPKALKPSAAKKRGKKAARTPSPQADGDGDGDEDGAGPPTPPPTSSRPRREGAKRDYAMLAGGDEEGDGDGDGGEEEIEDEDGMGKRVKIEVGEDIGEGLRQSTQFEDAMADGENGEDAFT
ncbi:hypothetical protein LTR12_012490 [Friedmanniomyces endolithicus]|nr:hypothetical protein LTR74_013789 [Friedmanniomyces endolithicus]KAK1813105.1 hypothetical protein LTR12_012490 [Friedmanniomyces endolithicus]